MLDPLIRSVVMMMNRFGGQATLLVSTGEETYDPETSTTTSAETPYQVRIIAQDYIQKTNGFIAQVGGMVQTGDKQFFIQPDDLIPMPRPGVDTIIFEGRKWNINTIKDYNPSGTKSYMYEVFARL